MIDLIEKNRKERGERKEPLEKTRVIRVLNLTLDDVVYTPPQE